jgi:hypothetical protein
MLYILNLCSELYKTNGVWVLQLYYKKNGNKHAITLQSPKRGIFPVYPNLDKPGKLKSGFSLTIQH